MVMKRGISAIVATVLIILITIAGITIFWAAILPLIHSSLDFGEMDARLDVVTSQGYTIYDSNSKLFVVQVRRNSGEEVKMAYLRITLSFNGTSYSETKDAPLPNQARTYVFNITNYVESYGPPTSVSVSPIFIKGNSAKEGVVTSEKDIPPGTLSPLPGDIDQNFGDGVCRVSQTLACGNNTGICRTGIKTCLEGNLWGECVGGTGPATEICDGDKDQDCNGMIDNGCACTNGVTQSCGVGACVGTVLCTAGVWGSCNGASPGSETCNNIDDDCDGNKDEGLSQVCGNNTGTCRAGTKNCTAGVWATTCTGTYVGPIAEICNDGLDNNCDGLVDNNCGCTLGTTQPCGNNTGVCRAGTQTCNSSGVFGVCTGTYVGPSAEVCTDTLDNNCNGLVDCLDGPSCNGATQSCGNNTGRCRVGTRTCSAGAWGSCSGAYVGPIAEICNNGQVDDDCDGMGDCNDNSCFGNPACLLLGNGLVAWWNMDSLGTNGLPSDYFGRYNTSGVTSPEVALLPTIVTGGPSGNYLKFSGAQCLLVNGAEGVTSPFNFYDKDFALSVWVYNYTGGSIIVRSESNSVPYNLGIGGGKPYSNVYIPSTHYTIYSDVLVNGTFWSHIVFSLNRAAGMGSFYVNNVPAGSLAIPSPTSNSNRVRIGCRGSGAPAGVDTFGSGMMDDLRVYNRSLSAAEVQILYNRG
jgi:hypothetical protein